MSDTHEQHAKVLDETAADYCDDANAAHRDEDPVCDWFRTRQLACEAGAQALRQQGQTWQPIETAPKDGTHVFVTRHMDGYGWILGVGRYEQVGMIGGWISWGTGPFGELGLAHPTHWQPLPAPPRVD